MTSRFGGALAVVGALALASTPLVASAQSASAESDGVPIATVLAAVAKSTGKRFIVDPRVTGDVLLLEAQPATLGYDDLLTVLQVHGFAAVASGDYVRVVPDAGVRHLAIPTAEGNNYRAAEYVTRLIPVKNIPAAMLVPTLRPLLPQQAHLVAMPCTNDLLMVDTFGNVQRIESLVKSLDRGKPYTPQCPPSEPVRAPAKPAKPGKE